MSKAFYKSQREKINPLSENDFVVKDRGRKYLNLPDNEIRNIRKYLESGKPLPDKYRFLLFEEKREVGLVWNGKTNEVTVKLHHIMV